MAIRKFAGEGCLHLYSSQANPLYPSELYLIDKLPGFRESLELCNLYLIARRKRIIVDDEGLRIKEGWLSGGLLVQRLDEWERVEFKYQLPEVHHAGKPDHVLVRANSAGSYVESVNVRGERILTPTYVLAASAECKLGSVCDLDVLYIGIGRKRMAADRLVSHEKLQRILAETMVEDPGSEILLLLFRYEHARILISTGGDLTLEPTATREEELMNFASLREVDFNRSQRIEFAEAALINHFQPPYNKTYVESDFAARNRRMKLLRDLDAKEVTGLMVEICTANIRSRLRSDCAEPIVMADLLPKSVDPEWMEGLPDEDRKLAQQEFAYMAHTHVAKVPLTTSEERNTFLHGTKWRDE